MCGRFVLITDLSVLARDFNLSCEAVNFSPSRNVSPGQPIVAIANPDGKTGMGLYVWGLIPFWAKDPSIGKRLINARAETLAQKPSFKNAYAKRRCLIPADGFYEWKQEGPKKVPYLFGLKSGGPMFFAGLYETWAGPDLRPVQTCAILTTQANALVLPVHERMPVIVSGDLYTPWLDPDIQDPSKLNAILKPYPPGSMTCEAVKH